MIIRGHQFEIFDQIELEKFELRVMIFLKNSFQDAEKVPQEDSLSVIRDQVRRAKYYGLQAEQQIVIYVTTAWLLGKQFDTEFPAAEEMLQSCEYSPKDKSEWLAQWATEIFSKLDGGE